MAFTVIPSAGAKIRSTVLTALITELRPITAEKGGDTTRTSDATRTADPDLVIALPASSTWDFEGNILVSSAANAAGDFQMELTYPANANVTLVGFGLDDTLASGTVDNLRSDARSNQDPTSPTVAIQCGASTTQTSLKISGRITLGATAGNLTVAWGQLTSNVNGTTLQNGSYITARRVS